MGFSSHLDVVPVPDVELVALPLDQIHRVVARAELVDDAVDDELCRRIIGEVVGDS